MRTHEKPVLRNGCDAGETEITSVVAESAGSKLRPARRTGYGQGSTRVMAEPYHIKDILVFTNRYRGDIEMGNASRRFFLLSLWRKYHDYCGHDSTSDDIVFQIEWTAISML